MHSVRRLQWSHFGPGSGAGVRPDTIMDVIAATTRLRFFPEARVEGHLATPPGTAEVQRARRDRNVQHFLQA
jgi:hypothetical protein